MNALHLLSVKIQIFFFFQVKTADEIALERKQRKLEKDVKIPEAVKEETGKFLLKQIQLKSFFDKRLKRDKDVVF